MKWHANPLIIRQETWCHAPLEKSEIPNLEIELGVRFLYPYVHMYENYVSNMIRKHVHIYIYITETKTNTIFNVYDVIDIDIDSRYPICNVRRVFTYHIYQI